MRKSGWAFLVAVIIATSSTAEAVVITTMYNDSVGPDTGGSHVNATNFSDIDVGSTPSGLLKNIDTGATTGITATHTAVNIEGSLGVTPTSGPANTVFDGFVDLTDSASYDTSGIPWSYSVVFTGLDPNSTYEFVTTANRDSTSYDVTAPMTDQRWGDFSIIGADTFANMSSVSPGVINVDADTVRLNSYQTVRGDIVRWTGITAADGSFEVLSASVPADQGFAPGLQGYGIQGFQLIEIAPDPPVDPPGPTAVPEPSSIALLACGMIGLIGYRRRQQKLQA